jgi:hypothetical protein
VPFTFKDREFGETKINFREARQAVWAILTLGLREWTGGLSGPQRKSSVTTEYGKKNGTG